MEIVTQLLKPATDYWLLTDRFKDIKGYLDPIEGFALHVLAAYGPGDGEIVEIGSLYGRSTCYLAAGAAGNGRGTVYAVDTFAGSAEHQEGESGEQDRIVSHGSTLKDFLHNVASHRLDAHIKPIVGISTAAAREWEKPIRLLFIDGDHSFDGTRDDFMSWAPFVVDSGLVAFHDVSTWNGVTRFYEQISRAENWAEVLSIGTLRVLQRISTDKASFN